MPSDGLELTSLESNESEVKRKPNGEAKAEVSVEEKTNNFLAECAKEGWKVRQRPTEASVDIYDIEVPVRKGNNLFFETDQVTVERKQIGAAKERVTISCDPSNLAKAVAVMKKIT